MWHAGILAYGMRLKRTTGFSRDPVDMHRSVTTLGGNILIQGIPGNPLNIMGMLSNLVNTFA
jgi:hypothetical protein